MFFESSTIDFFDGFYLMIGSLILTKERRYSIKHGI